MEKNVVQAKEKGPNILNDHLAALEAECDNRSEEQIVLGPLENYGEEQLLDWKNNHRMKLFVHNREIFITSFTSLLHKTVVAEFRFAILIALKELNDGAFSETGSLDVLRYDDKVNTC